MIPRTKCRVQAISADNIPDKQKKIISAQILQSSTGQNPSIHEPEQYKGDWRKQLSHAISDPAELCRLLELEEKWLDGALAGHQLFRTRVPHAYLSRMEVGNPDDPLLRQVLPIQAETDAVEGFIIDPLDEAEHSPCPGLIHKYHNRVLLITSGACAINCRYCFRRHFPYGDNTLSTKALETIITYLEGHPEITEVILSGGDPLASNDARLGAMVQRLESVPHLLRLRIHTRLPVVIPDRVDDSLLEWLEKTRLQKVIVLHINHPNEIDEAVIAAGQRLQSAGVTLLNQSVMLKGVNDNVDVLKVLSEKLFANGILPYYLHVLDPVAGAAHFDVPDEVAIAIVESLRKSLSGFLVPRLVREIPGEMSKTPLFNS